MNTPNDCSDDTINELWENDVSRARVTRSLENWEAALHPEMKRAEGLAKVFGRLEEIMHEPPVPILNAETLANGRVNEIDLRGADIRYEFKGTFRGKHIWWCWDAVNGQETFGEGESKKMALADFFEKREPRPRGRIVNLGNPSEPPEVIDDANFDSDLEDDDGRN